MLRQRYYDADGNPLAGGKLYTYQAGTTTPQATYTDQGGGTPNANPIVLDANGEAAMWLDPTLSYKFVLKNSSDVTQWTTDNVVGILTASAVTTTSIADDAVTTAKLADDSVTAAILADSASTDADRAVTTNHIRDAAVTPRKLSILPLGTTINIGLAAATTTNSNDSIKITSADGTALSSTNPGYVMLRSATGGQIQRFTITADVTILLTGAHWGLGTGGDRTDYPFHVYAINDAGTLKWGVGAVPGLTRLDGADDSASPGSITTTDGILVNSALSASSNAQEIGWFRANFDDTDGAAEDLWAVQTGAMDILMGPAPDGLEKPFITTGDWTGVTYTCRWAKFGANMKAQVNISMGGAPTGTSALSNIYLPTGLTIETTGLAGGAATTVPVGFGNAQIVSDYPLHVRYNTTTSVRPLLASYGGDGGGTDVVSAGITASVPASFGSGDLVDIWYMVPIVGWDGNIT